MKLSNSQIKTFVEFYIKFEQAKKELPFKLSYALLKNKRPLIQAYEDIEKMRIQLCETHADKDEKGNPVMANKNFKFSSEGAMKFRQEYIELMKQEIDVELHKVKLKIIEEWAEALEKQGRSGLMIEEIEGLSLIIDEE